MNLNHIQHQARAVSVAAAFAAGTLLAQYNNAWWNNRNCSSVSFCETAASPAISSLSSSMKESNQRRNLDPPPLSTSEPGPKLLFLGSGSSTGCPKPVCSLLFPTKNNTEVSSSQFLTKLQNEIKHKCQVSKIASIGNPIYNKNYRNNPSLLISHSNHSRTSTNSSDSETNAIEYKNVIIDVGKTFRETALRWMPLHSIYNIDAVVLTHEHADAVLGLDDLRGFQISPQMLKKSDQDKQNDGSLKQSMVEPLPIYLSQECFQTVKQQFGYLVPKQHHHDKNDDESKSKTSSPANKPVVKRFVASLDFEIIHHFQPFEAGGLKMIPLPVIHGEDLICNGYAFSVQHRETRSTCTSSSTSNSIRGNREKTNVVYLSDISRMIPETEEFILEKLPPTDILIIDSLNMKGTHPVHFSLEQALETVKRLNPKQTYIVGINCDDFPEHEEANELLKSIRPNVQLAYDGLVIEL